MNTPQPPSNAPHSLNLIRNVVTTDVYRGKLAAAAEEVTSVLAAHCGPFAADAVIPTRISRDDPDLIVDRFTKDGISIAKLLSTQDPMARYLLRLVVHVGEKVDAACHDGTTTSMLLLVALLMNGAQAVSNIASDQALSRNLPQWKKAAEWGIQQAQLFIESQKLTPDDLLKLCQMVRPETTKSEVRYALAYHEALLSSKGDVELSDAIAQVVSSLPDEMFGYYTIDNTPKETTKRYLTKVRDYDLLIGGNIKPSFYNHKLNTELFLEECDLLVTSVDPSIASPITTAIIAMMLSEPEFHAEVSQDYDRYLKPLELQGVMSTLEYLESPHTPYIERPVVILAPSWITCPHTDRLIGLWNTKYPDRKIIDAHIQPDALLRQSYASGISACAGAIPIEQLDLLGDSIESSIIRKASVRASTRTVRLYNLYEKNGDLFHPFYLDPKLNPFYTETLATIYEFIATDKDAHVSEFNEVQIKSLISLYRTMTCQRIVDLETGGSTHEAVTARDIVTDAYGSALSAIEDGVVLGGHPKLLAHFFSLFHTESDPRNADIAHSWVKALETLLQAIYRSDMVTESKPSDILDPTHYILPSGEGGVQYHAFIDQVSTFLLPAEVRNLTDKQRLKILSEKDNRILFQPYIGYQEQFRLFAGIIPNLLSSDKLISVG